MPCGRKSTIHGECQGVTNTQVQVDVFKQCRLSLRVLKKTRSDGSKTIFGQLYCLGTCKILLATTT